jgi:DNA primase
MDNTRLLLGIVETVLGRGKHTSRQNYAFNCPFCHHAKPKLEVDLQISADDKNSWNCWVCNTKGRSLATLLKKAGASREKILELKPFLKYIPKGGEGEEAEKFIITLPKEFKSLLGGNKSSITFRQAQAYAKKRGITEQDIIKYGIGYCETGRYANSLIVQSLNKDGKLNYFVGRSFEKDPGRKYNTPRCDKNEIVGLEYYVNWKCPVVLCEGIFDAVAIKRNAVPLFGKTISTALQMQLAQSEVKTVYIALDNDALKDALKHAQHLLDQGKEVYLVELDGKDPSDIGFQEMTKLLHQASPLSYAKLLHKKLELC